MNDEIRRMLEHEERMRRLTDSLRPIDEATALAKLHDSLAGSESLSKRLAEQQLIGKPEMDLITGRHSDPLGIAESMIGASEAAAAKRALIAESQSYESLIGNPHTAAADAARKLFDLTSSVDMKRVLGLDYGLSSSAAAAIGIFGPGSEAEAARRALISEANSLSVFANAFRRPGAAELTGLASKISASDALVDSVFGVVGSRKLQESMGAMRQPWTRIGAEERSFAAFADVQAIGQVIGSSPFDEGASALLRSKLGDWRDRIEFDVPAILSPVVRRDLYVERGFDPALADFTEAAFDEGTALAGLSEAPPVDGTQDAPVEDDAQGEREAGLARARAAFDQLQRFEDAVRRFVSAALQAQFGPDWMKQALPPQMLDGWRAKRETAIKNGETPLELIDYADFTDYKQIIEMRPNWKQVFGVVFGRQTDVQESFQRLFPVRIATMHARVITLYDEMMLRAETARVLSAIGRASRP